MKAYQANLLNGATLVLLGLWEYYDAGGASKAALVALAFGCLFLICSPIIRKEYGVVAYIVALLTLLVIPLLCYPFSVALGAAEVDFLKLLRQTTMLLTSILSVLGFARLFLAGRKSKR